MPAKDDRPSDHGHLGTGDAESRPRRVRWNERAHQEHRLDEGFAYLAGPAKDGASCADAAGIPKDTMTKKQDALTDADYEALANLRYTLRRFMDFSTSAAQEEGLPSQQHQALLAIRGYRGEEPMTIGILAERLMVAPHSTSELVHRLVTAGYVTRRPDPADKRRQTVELTARANDLLKRLSAIHLTEIRDMAPRLIELLSDLQKAGSE